MLLAQYNQTNEYNLGAISSKRSKATMNFEGEKVLRTVDYLFNATFLINAQYTVSVARFARIKIK